jgi:hypothetical protein
MLVNHKWTIARRLGKTSSDYFTSVFDPESGSFRLVDPVTPREEKQKNLYIEISFSFVLKSYLGVLLSWQEGSPRA